MSWDPGEKPLTGEEIRYKSLQDILKAEKELRTQAEETARGLSALLAELAHRLNGQAFIRLQETEQAPRGWTVERWREFFNQKTQDGDVTAWSLSRRDVMFSRQLAGEQSRLQAAFREIADLEQRIRELEEDARSLKAPRSQPAARSSPAAVPPAKPVDAPSLTAPKAQLPLPPSLALFVTDFFLKNLEVRIPENHAARFSRGEAARRRQLAFLMLMGLHGISTRFELYRLVTGIPALQTTMNSARDAMSQTEFQQMFTTDKEEILDTASGQKVVLDIIQISQPAGDVCRACNINSARSEWARLLSLYENLAAGRRQAAVTLFLMAHARIRGLTAAIPTRHSSEGISPLMLQSGSDALRVHVLLNLDGFEDRLRAAHKEKGPVHFCAMNPAEREQAVEFCRREKIPGRAADISSLALSPAGQVLDYQKIAPSEPFWLDSWR